MSVDVHYPDLDRETLRVLRYIYRKKVVSYGDLGKMFPRLDVGKAFRILRDVNYIYGDFAKGHPHYHGSAAVPEDESRLWCTMQGKHYAESRNTDWFREFRAWVALVLSVIAIIVSIISLALQFR